MGRCDMKWAIGCGVNQMVVGTITISRRRGTRGMRLCTYAMANSDCDEFCDLKGKRGKSEVFAIKGDLWENMDLR